MPPRRALAAAVLLAAFWAAGAAPLLAQAAPSPSPQVSPAPQPLPAAARQRLRQAAAAVDAGQSAAVIPQLRALARAYPRNPAVAETLGLALIHQQHLAAALPSLRRAAALAPRSAAILANLGVTELRLGHNDRGIAALQQAVSLQPANFDNIYDLGQALTAVKKYRAAARRLAQAHALRPDRPDVAYNWAWAEHRAGHNARAEAALVSVPALAHSAAAQSLWGAVAEARGQYQAAARHLETATRLQPSEANYVALGLEFLRHLTWNAARATFQSGLRRYPRSRPLCTALGMTAFGQSDFSAAATIFARLAAAAPASGFFAAMLGRSCLQGGIAQQAVCQRLPAQAAAHPANANAAAYAAVIALRSASGPASSASALRLAQQAIHDNPRLAEAHFAAGLALSRAGHWRQAIPQYQTALRLDPGGITAVYQLALAYQRTGQTALAQQMLRRHAQMAADQRRATNRRLARVRQFVTAIGRTTSPN